MPLGWFRAENFRCLAAVELELDPRANLFVGPNASGKTSILEAAFFLGRGRSFRSRRREVLVRHGQQEFLLAGRSEADPAPMTMGVRASREQTEWRLGGAPAEGVADLAEQFPAQVIDPEVHKLLEEGPGRRRRFMDWGVFHVEPTFLSNWRRYHQALRQRNAALKQGRGDEDLAAWEQELAVSGEELARQRDSYLARLAGPLGSIGAALLDRPITVVHGAGWDRQSGLLASLQEGRARDRRYKATQLGPHRGDVTIQVAGRPAKDQVSRGQQKLVASALMLAQLAIQEQQRPGRSALLLDDPAAELDRENLARLMAAVQSLPAQLWVTSLRADIPGLPAASRMFHVEQGAVRRG
ncbi:MAG: DNA replication/repair protein RecF [Steroidobacteraceae bacterium]|nr:DNA replication/repair protein RecF [Steroidobacteraceae bacterium]